MQRSARAAVTGVGVIALAGVLLAVGTALGSPSDPQPGASTPTAQEATGARRATGLEALQADAERVPRDPARWSALGLAYVQQARLTADPSWYAKADEALDRSMQIEPAENAEALTGQAALAAGQHNFADALRLSNASLALNDYSPTTYGVHVDALTEMGRYDEALTAAQRMLALRPGLDSYSRLSYAFELRGDIPRARLALEEAGKSATTPADQAFVSFYLGELAFSQGDLAGAAGFYDEALRADPSYLSAQAGRGKVRAATGETDAALADYRAVVDRLPQPSYLVELGELLEATGNVAEAQEQYDVVRILQQAFASTGSDVDSELALFEADHGDPAAALRFAEQAYRDRPDTISVQDAYAWALHANGRSDEALPVARQALRLGTRNPTLLAHLGTIEAAAGDRAAARTHLSAALELNPAFNPLLAPRAEELLASLP